MGNKLRGVFVLLGSVVLLAAAEVEFRVNHIGYGVKDVKKAFLCQFGSGSYIGKKFEVKKDGEIVYTGTISEEREVGYSPFSNVYVCDFSSMTKAGKYQLTLEGIVSDSFTVGSKESYKEVLNALLDFYQIQRCGSDDALLHAACHLNDKNAAVDCSGGWHDAGDYIKFMITASFVTMEMLTTYDYMNSYGLERALIDERGTAGIPDVLEEARVGVEWILKMTSDVKNNNLYFQVSGEEDHNYWRLPETDDQTGVVGNPRKLHKGWGQNLTGRSVAVLASASRLWKEYDKDFADACLKRALEIWEVRNDYKDIQTSEPSDFYGEWTGTDDMLMGAVELYVTTEDEAYLPFVDFYFKSINGYYIGWGNIDFLAVAACYRAGLKKDEALEKMKYILDYRKNKSEEHTFYRSSGLAWGTNANYPAEAQMAIMYKLLVGDDSFMPQAQFQRDYLLGANNWNISFIAGVGHRYPLYSHSQLNDLVDLHKGAVVGGPALDSSWSKILSLPKFFVDPYEKYQGDAVYYDWKGDYYTNEVAIDYSAAALFIMSYYYATVDGKTSIISSQDVNSTKSGLHLVQNGRTLKLTNVVPTENVVELCDLRGRILDRVSIKEEDGAFIGTVSSGISSGVYILRVMTEKQVHQTRLYLP